MFYGGVVVWLASHRFGGLLRIALVGCLKKLGGFGMIGGEFFVFLGGDLWKGYLTRLFSR